MQTLFLDLASHSGLLACVTDDQVVASMEADHKMSDAELIPAVENLLKEAGWSYQDITHVACATGPGGFTSLRVAVAYANTLADQLQIPSAGIHLSDLYAARAKNSPDLYWVHSTKKTELFIRGGEWKEPTLISLEVASSLPQKASWMGELIPDQESKLSFLTKAPIQPVLEILPNFLGQASYGNILLEPWYGRGW